MSKRKKKKRGDAGLAKSFRLALDALGYKEYSEYLKSDHWINLRRRLSKGATCCGCEDAGKKILLHHVEYGRLGSERDSDLIPVCKECHTKIHERLNIEFPERSVFYKARRTGEFFTRIFGKRFPLDQPREPMKQLDGTRPLSKRERHRRAKEAKANRLELRKTKREQRQAWRDKPRQAPSRIPPPHKPSADTVADVPESHRQMMRRKRIELAARTEANLKNSRTRLSREHYQAPLARRMASPATEKSPALAP